MAITMLDRSQLAYYLKEAKRALKAKTVEWSVLYLEGSKDIVLHVQAPTGQAFNILL